VNVTGAPHHVRLIASLGKGEALATGSLAGVVTRFIRFVATQCLVGMGNQMKLQKIKRTYKRVPSGKRFETHGRRRGFIPRSASWLLKVGRWILVTRFVLLSVFKLVQVLGKLWSAVSDLFGSYDR